MADGIKISSPTIGRNLERLRRMAPNLHKEQEKAGEANAREMADLAKAFSPGGDYGETIKAEIVERKEARNIWGVVAAWYWHMIEGGTAPGERVEKTGPRAGTVVKHPGTPAHPHIFSAYRLLKKRMQGRMKRAMNKAAKEALKK